tara:strand:+ start:345 stop:764 length:420 start_codon:yes stop_codon:yes gene_type:complete
MPITPGKGVGLRNVGSYQISGHPYVTGSTIAAGVEKKISFPYVTKSITVIASGSTADPLIGITFNSTGSTADVMSGKHVITMDSSGDSMTFDVKCKEIYIHAKAGNSTSGFELYASLTGISERNMYALTGSGLTTADGS